MMNGFRLAGDFIHLLLIIAVVLKICVTKSCAGISGRSQLLLALVYTTRYLDLLMYFISYYNSILKIVFILVTYATLYLIYIKFKDTYDREHDTFRIEYLLVPAALLACFVNYQLTVTEVLWAFSIYLEAVALAPQIYMIYKSRQTNMFIICYLLAWGTYRGLYIANWIYRYYVENHYDTISIGGGVVHLTLCYLSTIYVYIYFKEKVDCIYVLE